MTRSSQRCSALQRLDPLLAISRCLCTFFASGLNHLFVGPEGGRHAKSGRRWRHGVRLRRRGGGGGSGEARATNGRKPPGRSDGRKEARLAAANAFTIAATGASRRPLLLLDPRPTTTYDYECVNIVRKVEWAMPGSVALPSA